MLGSFVRFINSTDTRFSPPALCSLSTPTNHPATELYPFFALQTLPTPLYPTFSVVGCCWRVWRVWRCWHEVIMCVGWHGRGWCRVVTPPSLVGFKHRPHRPPPAATRKFQLSARKVSWIFIKLQYAKCLKITLPAGQWNEGATDKRSGDINIL